MRNLWLFIAVGLALVFAAPASASSTFDDFATAWSERDARYVEKHAALDKEARAATAAFLDNADPASAESTARLEKMIAAIKAASYVDGRGMILRDLRIHMAKKPTAARTDLWMQEKADSVRTQSSDLDGKFADLKRRSAAGQGETDSYFTDTIAALIMAATLQGQVEELTLVDANLGSYFQAKGQEDASRRQARARIFGAIGAALSSYSAPENSLWSATCTTAYGTTRCTGM